jgi:nucleoside-diphosphate kinase
LERTLILIKPDAMQRGLVGPILSRFEARGFKFVGLKLMQISRELASRHYAEHQGKPFYEGLVAFITSSPVIAGVLEGPNAIAITRTMMGATNPANAAPGTIRGDYALTVGNNVIHGSDGPEAAQREISLFFSADELLSYSLATESWVLGD